MSIEIGIIWLILLALLIEKENNRRCNSVSWCYCAFRRKAVNNFERFYSCKL